MIENEWREFDQYYDIGEKVFVNSFDICSIGSDSNVLNGGTIINLRNGTRYCVTAKYEEVKEWLLSCR